MSRSSVAMEVPPTSTSLEEGQSGPVGDFLELQWTEHQKIFSKAISKLRSNHVFTDATLACDGQFYPVHKFVLATCSEFFSACFEWTPCVNPILVLNNIATRDLEALLDFMYTGEASVRECHLDPVMKAAQCLRVQGLALLDETRPVMHKPPASTIPAQSVHCPAIGPQHHVLPKKPSSPLSTSTPVHPAFETKVPAALLEPPNKRRKPEITDVSLPALPRPKSKNSPSVSLPSISSLTSPVGDPHKAHITSATSSLYSQSKIHPHQMTQHAPLRTHQAIVAPPQAHPSSQPSPRSSYLTSSSSHLPPGAMAQQQQLATSSGLAHHPQQQSVSQLPVSQQKSLPSNRHLQQLLCSPRSGQQQYLAGQAQHINPQLHYEEMQQKQLLLQKQKQLEQQRLQLQQQLGKQQIIQRNVPTAAPRPVSNFPSTSAISQQQPPQQLQQQQNFVAMQQPQYQQVTSKEIEYSSLLQNFSKTHLNNQTKAVEQPEKTAPQPSGEGSSEGCSNGNTPTGNNNNLSTGNNNLIAETVPPSTTPNNASEATSAQPTPATESAPQPPPAAAANSGVSANVVLTPMEQQIISELGAAETAAQDTGDKADNEEMLDMLGNDGSLLALNDEADEAKEKKENAEEKMETEADESNIPVPVAEQNKEETDGDAANANKDRRKSRVGRPRRRKTSISSTAAEVSVDEASTSSIKLDERELSQDGMETSAVSEFSSSILPADELPGASGINSSDLDLSSAANSLLEMSEEAFASAAGGGEAVTSLSGTKFSTRYKCLHCPKVCHKPETLAKHMETHKDKSYPCTTCGYIAVAFEELRDHRKIHQNKKCSRCDYATNRADALKKHLAHHVGPQRMSADRSISCAMCDFVSKNQIVLKHHMKFHHDNRNRRDHSL